MAHIQYRLGKFTGHVGPIRFRDGEAETEDGDMLAYFLADPDTYDVTEDDTDDGDPDDEPDDPDGE